jgi:4-hydroxybutyrate CoA-transferase
VYRALSRVPATARIVCSPGCSTPETLLDGLASRAQSRPGDTLHAGLLVGDLGFLTAVSAGNLGFETWHVAARARRLMDAGKLSYIPLRASDVATHLRGGFDACLVRVGPPDTSGYCSLGPSLTYTRRAMHASRTVIAEVDPTMPRTCGDTLVRWDDFTAVVESAEPMPEYDSSAGPVADRIAATVLTLLPERPTLQLGIGAIPEALARQLVTAGWTGLSFVGMVSDAIAELVEVGAADSVEAVELMGSADLMKSAHRNDRVRMVSSDHCHDARRMARRPRFTSVNSALAIDLSGQVASEGLGTRVVAGIGGSVDFFEAARMSDGGCRILAMTASAPGGTSRILARLPAGTPVTLPHHLVDVVVTEHGVARLAGKSLGDRAEALIAVAAPEHRDDLAQAERWRMC